MLTEIVVLAALVGLINLAFWMLEVGRWAYFVAVLAPTSVWAASLMYRQKFRRSKQTEGHLEKVVGRRGYRSIEPKQAIQFVKHSFLRNDLTIELKSLWAVREDAALITWGRYATGGESLSSGIYCTFQCNETPDPMRMGELLSGSSTVYFDDHSKTIFGTLQVEGAPAMRDLHLVQWQYLGATLIGRIDSDLLEWKQSSGLLEEEACVERLVISWEALSQWLTRQLNG